MNSFRKQTGKKPDKTGQTYLFLSMIVLILIFMAAPVFNVFAQTVTPVLSLNDPGTSDQDDMCIWIHPDPPQSTIITSDKGADKLFVYDLNGNTLQTISVPGQPGNIDVRYNFPLSGQLVDIVGYNDRSNETIVIYKVDPATRHLTQVANFDAGNWPSELYGFCFYRSPGSGKYYAFGCATNSQMRQWELVDNGDGTIGGIEKRTWFNGPGSQTEGMVADDETGKLYAANESHGVYKYDAEPLDPNPVGELIAPTGSNGLTEDVEGVTIYYMANGEGYLIVSSQGSDDFKVYERKAPHNFVKTFSVSGAGDTDGIDVANLNLGTTFSEGLFALHNDNSTPKEVLVCKYEDLGLQVDTGYWNPRNNGSTTSITPEGDVPQEFSLFQNYPNPFNPVTKIRISLPYADHVEVAIFDIVGRKVATVTDDFYNAGSYVFQWQAEDNNGNPLPSGIYFARMQAGEFSDTIKMIYNR